MLAHRQPIIQNTTSLDNIPDLKDFNSEENNSKKIFKTFFEGEYVLKIPLFNNKNEVVEWSMASVEDHDLLSKYRWRLYEDRTGKRYAQTLKNGKPVFMHTLIVQNRL